MMKTGTVVKKAKRCGKCQSTGRFCASWGRGFEYTVSWQMVPNSDGGP